MNSSGALGTGLLALAVLAPLVGGALTAAARRRGERAARASVGATAIAALAAVALLVVVAADGTVAVTAGTEGPGLVAGRVGALLLVLVTVVGLVVQAYAVRYLTGDPRFVRFFLLTALAVSSTAAMVCAATIVGLALAWVVAGAALVALLRHERDLPAARRAARRAATIFTVGDVALVLAAALIVVVAGDLSLRDPLAAADALDGREVLGVGVPAMVTTLVVLAALARSAQVPLGGWLPGTVAAPTPVSALLHAGIVNGGGILLVLLAPIVVLAPGVVLVAFAAGAVTALYGTVLMLARPDVKGRLAHSTMGQMGFMVLQCSLGALSAALFHLFAHGLYKATLFLGSGSILHERERLRRAPRPALPPGGTRRAVVDATLASALALGTLAAAVELIAPAVAERPGGVVLLAFAWATAAQAGFWWLRLRVPGDAGRLATSFGALAVCVAAYVGLLGVVEAFLAPALPAMDLPGWAPAWLALPVLAVAGLALVAGWVAEASPAAAAGLAARVSGLHRAGYAAARRAGDVPDTVRAIPARLDPTPARSR